MKLVKIISIIAAAAGIALSASCGSSAEPTPPADATYTTSGK